MQCILSHVVCNVWWNGLLKLSKANQIGLAFEELGMFWVNGLVQWKEYEYRNMHVIM